ncbi:hypothetical protein ACWDHH_02890 [Janibacter hoylei]|uniref:Uncharacterized protein n=1 Tax=Janibacter hoylei PVAS-1 TaxID=1210046 RepID=A0A444B8N8_9MICO|nr:hypothetical protein [Janibacter hoylei]MCT1620358.1 hypothetical protein [Janibacter hoylei]RWU84753.1 hypothetical protein CWN80_04045 [Janibacter hoylei PVAS-1]
MEVNSPSTEVSPGIWAFIVFFVLALALWLLMRNMFTRLRRMNLAERDAQRQRAEQERAREESAERSRESDVASGREQGSAGLGDGPEEGERRGDEV